MITNPFGFAFDLGLTALFAAVAIWNGFVHPSNNRIHRLAWKSLAAVAVLWLAILLIVASDYKP